MPHLKNVSHNEDFDKKLVLHNIRKYENHSSITKIKNSMPVKSHLSSDNTLASVRQVTSDEVNLILKSLRCQKGVWYGQNTNKTGKLSIKLSIKAISNSYQ